MPVLPKVELNVEEMDVQNVSAIGPVEEEMPMLSEKPKVEEKKVTEAFVSSLEGRSHLRKLL